MCNFKFIETPDHVYIINDYHKGTVSGTVYKYKYNKDSKPDDIDYILNISMSPEMYVESTITDSGSNNSIVSKYRYRIIPVYNTSSEGYWDKESVSTQDFYTEVDIKKSEQVVSLYIVPVLDPFILGYKIYRTKYKTTIIPARTVHVGLTNKLYPESYEAKIQVEDFYFLAYVIRPDNRTSTGLHRIYVDKNMNNDQLGEAFAGVKPVNYTWHGSMKANPSVIQEKKYLPGYGMLCTCGLYAQNRCFAGGDGRYPSTGFVSELDKSDYYGAFLYAFDLASLENRQTTIQEVGNNIYWFLKNSMYVLKPTSDALVPYTKELVSPTVGCDSLNSACVLEGICYFIFNNKLWAINEFSQYKEISTAINTQLDDKSAGSEIILKANASERYIKIMYRNMSNEAVNIDYYPVHDIFSEQTGDKDIYTVSGSTATLVSQDDRYKLVNYEQLPDLNEEWGVDIDGNLIKRGTDYQDASVGGDKVTWINYTADSTAAVKTYPVNAVLEKPWAFSATVKANCVVIYGTGNIDVASATDGGAFSAYRTYTMTRTGVTIPLTLVGHIISVRLRHTANTDIDYDFMKLVYTPYSSVDVTNDVSGGE